MHHILDIHWREEGKNNNPALSKYISEIKIYDTLSKEIKSFELNNYFFKFKLSEKRYCTGYYKDGQYHLCKLAGDDGLGIELDSDSFEQCKVCERIQGFKNAFFFQGEANENMQKHLSQPHYIYLAYFEPGIIKVGTAVESRMNIRTLEQDALIYGYIAQSDGFNIQKLEKFISKNIGIPENVKSAHKFKYLSRIPDAENGEDLIKSNFQKIIDLVQGQDFQSWLFDSVKVVNLSENPALYFPTLDVHLIKTPEYLVGRYLGLRGRYLILENYGKIVAFDIKPIIGRTFEYVEDYEYKIESENQIGLGL